jgi:ribosomal protein L30/L7E
MIRNVPKEYTQQDLEDEMRMLGLSHTYHKLYIPPNQSVKENVVYAFVHLNSVEMLEQFY